MNIAKKILNKVFSLRYVYVISSFFAYLLMAVVASAQDVGTAPPTQDTLGKVNNLNELFYWIINVMKYVGWAGVLIGVFIVLALLVYKLIAGDDSETMKKVRDGITRAIIIVVIGILLLSGSFIIGQVASLIGSDAPMDLNDGNWKS